MQEEISFDLVGKPTLRNKIIMYIMLAGMMSFSATIFLDDIPYKIRTALYAVISFAMIVFFYASFIRPKPGREILLEKVKFAVNTIVLSDRRIDLCRIKTVDATLRYYNGPNGVASGLADGSENKVRLVYQDLSEEIICFYIEKDWQLRCLERILSEAKRQNGFVLIK
jgi:hypothetical protein